MLHIPSGFGKWLKLVITAISAMTNNLLEALQHHVASDHHVPNWLHSRGEATKVLAKIFSCLAELIEVQ